MSSKSGNGSDAKSLIAEAMTTAQNFGFTPSSASLCGTAGHSLVVQSLNAENNSSKLFLKWSNTQPIFAVSVYLQLIKQGVNLVPDYYKTPDSTIILPLESGKFWTCQPYIGGEIAQEWLQFNCSPQLCFRAGEALAQIHDAGSKVMRSSASSLIQPVRLLDILKDFPVQFFSTFDSFRFSSDDATTERSDSKLGAYGMGVRAQVFEVIVRQALAGAPWREICAGPMKVNAIMPDEIQEEVNRRKGILDGGKAEKAEKTPKHNESVSHSKNKLRSSTGDAATDQSIAEPASNGMGIRAQIFEVIVRQAIAGAPWREICAGPLQANTILPHEIEEEVKRRTSILAGREDLEEEAQKLHEPVWPGKYKLAATKVLQNLPFQNLRKEAEQLSNELCNLERRLPQTINHGDYHPGNLLFSTGGIVGVVDWEFACIGSYLFDLSYALFMFCLEPPVDGKIRTELFNSRKTELFLEGYASKIQSSKDMQHLEKYTEFVHLLMLDWACHELSKPHSAYVENPGFLTLACALAYCCHG